MKNYPLFLLLLMTSACSTVDKKQAFESIDYLEPGKPLSQDTRVAIQIPSDGRFENTIYVDSGEKTATAFKSAFEEYVQSVKLLPGCYDQRCLTRAKNNGSDYFVSLEIIYWEDRATNWSGKLDRLTIKVSMFDVSTGTELSTTYLHTNSSIDAPDGGHVEDFLPSLTQQYVASLF